MISLVLDEPSNSSMIHVYETRAKNHLDQYLNLLLKKKPKINEDVPTLIGRRKSNKKPKNSKIPHEVTLRFFENMIQGFNNFKNYCSEKNSYECSILDEDDAILAKALKEYDNKLKDFKG